MGGSYTESGALWDDIRDFTGIVMPFSGSVDTNNTGSYTLEYKKVDAAGNTGVTTRIVNVLSTPDTTPPVVTLSGSTTVNVEYGTEYVEDGASWTDNVDISGSTFVGIYGQTGSFAISGSVDT